jgi:hypothetical protein
MAGTLSCWKCGASLEQLPLPLGRSAECKACGAELHVCRLCEFYDPRAAKACREPVAEEVQDKTRANFCDYFQPRPLAYAPPDDSAVRAARGQLATLFRSGAGGAAFAAAPSDVGEARQKLERLFGAGDKKPN